MTNSAQNPPEGFNAIWRASEYENKGFSTIGVVIDLLPPTTIGQGDWVITFELADEVPGSGLKLKCRVFAKTREDLPQIGATGDVVVLHNLFMKMIRGQPVLSASAARDERGSWVVFAGSDLLAAASGKELPFTKKSEKTISPDVELQKYALRVFNMVGEKVGASVLMPMLSQQLDPPQDKFKLIQDLKLLPWSQASSKPTIWADLLCEVTRMWPRDDKTELYITDYTSNEDLYNYSVDTDGHSGRDGDEFNYTFKGPPRSGPSGKRTLMLTLWRKHSDAGRILPVGSCVKFENVRIRWDHDQTKMEGSMDKTNASDKVGIFILSPTQRMNDPRYKELVKRKAEYLQSLKEADAEEGEEEEGQAGRDQNLSKRPAEAELTEAQKKTKKNRDNKQRKKKNRGKGKGAQDGSAKNSGNETKSSKKSSPSNVRIDSAPETTTPVTIAEIIDPSALTRKITSSQQVTLPFRNNLYHLSNIRVIGYSPSDLAYFAAPCWNEGSGDESGSDGELEPALDETGSPKWEWRFELELEDASVGRLSHTKERGRMKLLVAGEDANYLLHLKAEDLRKNNITLQKLKERLFLIWGELEEKGGKISNGAAGGSHEEYNGPPFQALVREYGVKPPGSEVYEREFAICMTRIVMVVDGSGDTGAEVF